VVKVDEEDAVLLEPKDFFLDHADGRLTLHFTLPLETPVDGRLGVVTFAVYDPSYFVDFAFAKETPVRLAQSAPAECQPRLEGERPEVSAQAKSLSESFFGALGPGSDFGVQFAQSVRIECGGR
jgi:ABC-type uncharacterized transport system substrate-binding protein